jgi:hypothetical protein
VERSCSDTRPSTWVSKVLYPRCAGQLHCIEWRSVCRFAIQATLDRLEPEVHLSDISNADPVMSASSNSARWCKRWNHVDRQTNRNELHTVLLCYALHYTHAPETEWNVTQECTGGTVTRLLHMCLLSIVYVLCDWAESAVGKSYVLVWWNWLLGSVLKLWRM